jgi:hypothetical protein
MSAIASGEFHCCCTLIHLKLKRRLLKIFLLIPKNDFEAEADKFAWDLETLSQ